MFIAFLKMRMYVYVFVYVYVYVYDRRLNFFCVTDLQQLRSPSC